MSRLGALCAVVGFAFATPAAGAELELRDGTRLDGKLVAATPAVIQFQTARGVRLVSVDEVAALRFVAEAKPAPPAQAPLAPAAAPAAPAASLQRVQLAAGTRLRVRIQDSIDPRLATQGDRFSALLETPIVAGDRTVVPALSAVYGAIAVASPTGPPSSRLQLELTGIQLAGQSVSIVTGTQQRVEAPGAAAPANAATPADAHLARGALLEFRLLQPLELVVRER